jgi:hypothetical protein
MLRRIAPFLAAGVLATLVLVVAAIPASAHEDFDVGPYTVAIGFGDEPAYVGQPNSVQILVSQNEKPLTALSGSLKAEVTFGDNQPLDLDVEPFFEVGEFGTPGDYRAWFIPTTAGQYTFHVTGSIHGTKVDETATSGPTTFSDVETGTDLEYPLQQRTTTELNQKLDRELPRLNDAITRASSDAANEASSAKTLAILGIIVGALGVVVGGTAILFARRRV